MQIRTLYQLDLLYLDPNGYTNLKKFLYLGFASIQIRFLDPVGIFLPTKIKQQIFFNVPMQKTTSYEHAFNTYLSKSSKSCLVVCCSGRHKMNMCSKNGLA